jgi:hypothetical protein
MSQDERESGAGFLIDRNLRVDIIAYVMDIPDPEKLHLALDGIATGFEDLLNDSTNYHLPYTENGTTFVADKCHLFQTNFMLADKVMMRQVVPAVMMEWRAMTTYYRKS